MTTLDPATFSPIILEILSNQSRDLPEEYRKELRDKAWLSIHGRCLCPTQILRINSQALEDHLDRIIQLNNNEFISLFDLPSKERSIWETLQLVTTWNAVDVIKFILKSEHPSDNTDIICDALKVLESDGNLSNQNLDQLFQQLKTTDWIPWNGQMGREAIAPSQVLYYPDIQDEIEDILNPDDQDASGDYVSFSQISERVANHDGFQWLTNRENFFIKDRAALQVIGEFIQKRPDFWIGELSESDFSNHWSVLENVTADVSKGWAIAKKLNRPTFQKNLLNSTSRNPEDSNWIISLLKHISSNNHNPDRETIQTYNCYLRIACQYADFSSSILPEIKLLNQKKEWKNPAELAWEEDLVVSPRVVLDPDQRKILNSHLGSLVKPSQSIDSNNLNPENIETNLKILSSYFKPWESRTKSQFIGAFLCLLSKDDEDLEMLASGYLNRNIDLIRSRLLSKEDISQDLRNVQISLNETKSISVFSVTGQYFSVPRSENHLDPTNFNIVENVNAQLEPAEITLTTFNVDDFRASLDDLLKRSIIKIISRLYLIRKSDLAYLEPIWTDLLQSKQLDIQVARNFILEGAPFVLPELGVHQVSTSLNLLLQEWDRKRHDRAELESQGKSTQTVDQQIKQIIQQISNLLESDSNESTKFRLASLKAIREKIKKFGYEASSIPFEIFQNADDAVVEMERITSCDASQGERNKFVLEWNHQQITFMHWGRPINLCWVSDNAGKTYKEKGFDRDLEKMLMLNISDKTSGMTGKFGLGFKSIHLVTQNPQVVSGDLGFTICGGLLPRKLPIEMATDGSQKTVIKSSISSLRDKLKQVSPLKDGTLIKIPIDSEIQEKSSQIIQRFCELIPLLLVFSKRIQCCEINGKPFVWEPKNILGLERIESGRIQLPESLSSGIYREHQILCLRPRLSQQAEEAALLIGFTVNDGQIKASLPKELPTFWVTAPTREKLPLGFIINANFDITTGRDSLAKQSNRNQEIAVEIGDQLGSLLSSLFKQAKNRWSDFLADLGISTFSEYDFWSFMWRELVTRWLKSETSSSHYLTDLIRQILGGQRGMGHLITDHAALPTCLWGDYQQLVKPQQVKYFVQGILATESSFSCVAQWPRFREKSLGYSIHETVWSDLKSLLGEDASFQPSAEPLQLLKALDWEIQDDSQQVDCEQANYLGRLVTTEFLTKLGSSEAENLKKFLDEISFKAENSNFYCANRLIFLKSEDPEEKRLSAFAPSDRLLNHAYRDSSLSFFQACRTRRDSIDIDTLVDWVFKVERPEQKEAVFQYLYDGDQRDNLARKLLDKTGWFSDDLKIQEILQMAKRKDDIKSGQIEPTLPPTPEPARPQPDGTGDVKWGPPGEYLAETFYRNKLNYEIHQTGKVVDFECVKDHERFDVEVKTISSNALRLPMYEWDRLMSPSGNYELLIVHHDGKGHVKRLLRIRDPKKILKIALERLNSLGLTNNSHPNVESLLGLQQDRDNSGEPINVVILDWHRLFDEFAGKHKDSCDIEIYPCQATLVKEERKAIDIQWNS